MTDYKKQGKRNRQAGLRFEKKVREDLEKKGWFVSKWQNNVELIFSMEFSETGGHHNLRGKFTGKIVPAKMGKFRSNQNGFPDFIAFRHYDGTFEKPFEPMEVVFIECKSNGYLSKEEKEKAKWYLENKYCSKFLIASKKKVGRKIEVEYKELEK